MAAQTLAGEFLSRNLQRAWPSAMAHLRVLPLFLATGAHVGEDIPRQIAAGEESFPRVKIELLQPIGEHPRVLELFREIACDYARD